jgi:uncharacterized protein YkwD
MASMRLFLALAATLPVPLSAQSPPEPSFEERLLAAHNGERIRLKLKPLVWSERLAKDAEQWAKHQAATDTFEHSDKTDDGENLWMGTRNSYTPEDMVGAWLAERVSFKQGLFPKVSTTGNWLDVGHYTQLIWFNTTSVGCARASNQKDDYLVCRYDPPGNWMGQNPFGR